jgi:hypothetical protein
MFAPHSTNLVQIGKLDLWDQGWGTLTKGKKNMWFGNKMLSELKKNLVCYDANQTGF